MMLITGVRWEMSRHHVNQDKPDEHRYSTFKWQYNDTHKSINTHKRTSTHQKNVHIINTEAHDIISIL